MSGDDTRERAGLIAGIFNDEGAAAAALKALVEAHFDVTRDVNVIVAHRREHETVPVTEDIPVERFTEVGTVVGSVLGAAGAALVATGIVAGPAVLFASGPILAALEGAVAGGAAGYAAGAIESFGNPKVEADFHESHIHAGAVWVGVKARGKRADEARAIMRAQGAKHFQQ